ncbi:DUF5819 family protein [Streptomyces sp. NPDC003077]|uniref:DUF5819 family protein n=1 Tax=Streptomyces sp. NPDC003077 TaxID=3154443 RepID=UPI0033A228AA
MQSYGDEPRPLVALSLPSRVIVVVAAGAVALALAIHLGMTFLHVAPPNTVSKQYSKEIGDYVYPEYEQNWKLFAPNPLQQNIAVQARAQLRTRDGGTRTTGWTDLSARDGQAIRHNLFPSHTQQNVLRRAWEFFVTSHDAQNRATGPRGRLSERYVRRIVMARLGAEWAAGGAVERVQVRSMTTPVGPPPWSAEKVATQPVYRVVPWWPVTAADLPEGATHQ